MSVIFFAAVRFLLKYYCRVSSIFRLFGVTSSHYLSILLIYPSPLFSFCKSETVLHNHQKCCNHFYCFIVFMIGLMICLILLIIFRQMGYHKLFIYRCCGYSQKRDLDEMDLGCSSGLFVILIVMFHDCFENHQSWIIIDNFHYP